MSIFQVQALMDVVFLIQFIFNLLLKLKYQLMTNQMPKKCVNFLFYTNNTIQQLNKMAKCIPKDSAIYQTARILFEIDDNH